MYLDQHGLPVQSDGDALDQLQRCGMIVTASLIKGQLDKTSLTCLTAMNTPQLQPHHGIYVRCTHNFPSNCSADQLISILCARIAAGNRIQAFYLAARMFFRLGFAQNYRDGIGTNKLQIPDFMLFRALPLLARMYEPMYAFTIITDLLLIPQVLFAIYYAKQSQNNVDQNDTIMTLAVCNYRMATPISWLSAKIFTRFLPENFGSVERFGYEHGISNVQAALNWYHRKGAGGNEEIAEMWSPIVKKYIG